LEDNSSEIGGESNEEEDSLRIGSLNSDLSEKAKVAALATNMWNCQFGRVKKHEVQPLHWMKLYMGGGGPLYPVWFVHSLDFRLRGPD